LTRATFISGWWVGEETLPDQRRER